MDNRRWFVGVALVVVVSSIVAAACGAIEWLALRDTSSAAAAAAYRPGVLAIHCACLVLCALGAAIMPCPTAHRILRAGAWFHLVMFLVWVGPPVFAFGSVVVIGCGLAALRPLPAPPWRRTARSLPLPRDIGLSTTDAGIVRPMGTRRMWCGGSHLPRGVTLVSAVTALLVIVTALMLATEGLVTLLSVSRVNEQRLVALESADGYLELLRAGVRPLPSSGTLDITEAPGLAALPGARAHLVVRDSDAPGIAEVEITITWRAGPRRSRLHPQVSLFACLPKRVGERP